MLRIYLLSIILAVLIALLFGDSQFLIDLKPITIWGKQISLNTVLFCPRCGAILKKMVRRHIKKQKPVGKVIGNISEKIHKTYNKIYTNT